MSDSLDVRRFKKNGKGRSTVAPVQDGFEMTDADLIATIQADPGLTGDGRDALGQLYHRHAWRILLRLQRIAPAAAEDLLHDTWLRVAASLPTRYQEHQRFVGWLLQIASNLARDWHRRKKGESLSGIDHPDEEPFPLETLISQECCAKLRECLQELPADQRIVVEGRLNGVSPERLSQRLKVARGTIDTRYCRAVERLRKCMEHR